MARIEIQTPSRLHLGLLGWGGNARREFGSVGLMIDRPRVCLSGSTSDRWAARGLIADRVLEFAQRVAAELGQLGHEVEPVAFEIEAAPPEHVGLGVGTQLGMAVARVVGELAGVGDLSAHEWGRLAGRGRRSGIGVHGFGLGGLIVDGGQRRNGSNGPPPLLTRLAWPEDWYLLVVIPRTQIGLHGAGEVRAFRDLMPPSDSVVDRLGRLVLLDLLPSVVEAHLDDFGSTLDEIQALIGQAFAPAQGGAFASPEAARIGSTLRELGCRGVGQSSWGPTVYGVSAARTDERAEMLRKVREESQIWDVDRCFWTSASRSGAVLSRYPVS